MPDCENSPVTLNLKQDWDKYKILEWHDCFGVLVQNYKNKKKWKSIFKNGLPNGYGTVKYEKWDGYYEGSLLEGKMHGKGKYINSKDNNLDIKCENNYCEVLNKGKNNNDYYVNKEKYFAKNLIVNPKNNKTLDYKNKYFYETNESNSELFESNSASNILELNKIIFGANMLPVKKNLISNQINTSVTKSIKLHSKKIFK